MESSSSKPRYLLSEFMMRSGLSLSFIRFQTLDGSKLCLHNEGIALGLWNGSYVDSYSIQFCLDYLKEGDLSVDIGANIGHFAIAMANRVSNSGTVVAIEPNPVVFRRLIDNVLVNKLNNIISRQLAIAMEDRCMKTFYVPRRNSAEGALGTKRKLRHYKKFQVLCRSGQSLLRELGLADQEVALIKIDVEGAELEVLEGLGAGIQKINCIMFEYSEENYSEMGYEGAKIIDYLRLAGFEVFEVDSSAKKLTVFSRYIERTDLIAARDINLLQSRTGYILVDRK